MAMLVITRWYKEENQQQNMGLMRDNRKGQGWVSEPCLNGNESNANLY